MSTRQPTKEELKKAIEAFVKKACERVAKIPLEQRVILSYPEALELERRRAEKKLKEGGSS